MPFDLGLYLSDPELLTRLEGAVHRPPATVGGLHPFQNPAPLMDPETGLALRDTLPRPMLPGLPGRQAQPAPQLAPQGGWGRLLDVLATSIAQTPMPANTRASNLERALYGFARGFAGGRLGDLQRRAEFDKLLETRIRAEAEQQRKDAHEAEREALQFRRQVTLRQLMHAPRAPLTPEARGTAAGLFTHARNAALRDVGEHVPGERPPRAPRAPRAAPAAKEDNATMIRRQLRGIGVTSKAEAVKWLDEDMGDGSNRSNREYLAGKYGPLFVPTMLNGFGSGPGE